MVNSVDWPKLGRMSGGLSPIEKELDETSQPQERMLTTEIMDILFSLDQVVLTQVS